MTLDKRYDEIMERVEVTPEMRRRILKNIGQTDLAKDASPKVMRFPYMKQLAALAACLVLVLVGALALPGLWGEDDTPNVLLPNGFTTVENAAALEAAVGFPAEGIGRLPFAPEEIAYSYLDGMAQIIYRAGAQEAVWRKAPGGDDISGDYTAYPQVETVDGVTLKGGADGFRLAVWTDGGYSYALSLAPGAALSVWLDMLPQTR